MHAATSTIVSGVKARELVLQALSVGARAIGSSLGPDGQGLVYDGGSGGPRYADSGLAIARQITQESGAGSVALRILKDALWEVQRELGDGTARVACVAVATYAAAAKHVAHGISPALLCEAVRDLMDELPGMVEAQRCTAPDAFDIAHCACPDEEVARVTSDIFARLPERGAVDIQEARGKQVKLEMYAGYCIDILPETVGASREEQGLRMEMDSVHVLVVNEILHDFGPLARVLEQFAQRSKSLVIVARGFEGAARATLIANRAGLRMHVLGLVPSEVGEQAMHVLADLCVASGATLVSEETGTSMANVTPAMLGRASRAIVEGRHAVFVGPAGDKDAVNERRKLILSQVEAQRYLALDREKLQRRAARFAGDWAVLRVGGVTQWETERRVDGARAALAALDAASKSGVVDGGGRALLAVANALSQSQSQSQSGSASAVRRAALDSVACGCRAVAAQLAKNAGAESAASDEVNRTVDPLSTTLSILQRAASVAATMLTIEVLIC
jgi:chaperonin GroEL